VCEQWVVKETQDADIIRHSDNDSEAKTDQDDVNVNGERWRFEARMDRSVVSQSNEAPLTTTVASPNIMEFEAYLEHALAPRQSLPIVQTLIAAKRKRKSKTDEFWEGVLEREKLRLLNVSESSLTPVEAMMVGGSSNDDNGDTTIERTTYSQAKEKSSPIHEPNEASSGA
jgi:hypothetical protein